MAEQTKERRTKIAYSTNNEIWGKVVHVKTSKGFRSCEEALDYLVNKGYDSCMINESE